MVLLSGQETETLPMHLCLGDMFEKKGKKQDKGKQDLRNRRQDLWGINSVGETQA